MFTFRFHSFKIVSEDNFQWKPEEVKANLSVKFDNNTVCIEVFSSSEAPSYENRN